MFKYFRHPDIPTSSPDLMTFPFEFKSFQFTMDNFVRSFTRKRVTKEDLAEVVEEVNAAIKNNADNFKTWDYLSIVFLLAVNAGILACILTMDMKYFTMFLIKLGVIFFGIILNFVVWLCCLSGSTTTLRDKIQNILDARDEYFDSKGMKWALCSDTDFPYWIELHIQSQFEIKAQNENPQQVKQQSKGEKQKGKDIDEMYSGGKDVQNNQFTNGKKIKKEEIPRLIKQTNNRNGFADLGIDEDDAEYEQSHVQPKPIPPQEVEIDAKDKKMDRLYAPLEEDYEEVYDVEANL